MATLMRKAAVAPAKATRTTVKASASLQRVAQAAGVAVAGFSLALSANAANVKLGADSGEFACRTLLASTGLGHIGVHVIEAGQGQRSCVNAGVLYMHAVGDRPVDPPSPVACATVPAIAAL
jgi:hypothetical protein